MMISLFRWKSVPAAAVPCLCGTRTPRPGDGRIRNLCVWFALAAVSLFGTARAGDSNDAAPLVNRFCTECHGGDDPEAHLNLEQLSRKPDFATQFRRWEKVIERVKDGRMPPPDASQPTAVERTALIDAIAQGLNSHIERHTGDPGKIAMRQLTS